MNKLTSKRIHIIGACLIFLLLTFPIASAQALSSADLCTNDINLRLAREQRLYRSVLFGRKTAKDELLGTTRYDESGTAWINMGVNAWRTAPLGGGKPGQRTDLEMEAATERDPLLPSKTPPLRRGIFETRGALTSDLVPSLAQAFRALGCRITAVCENARRSYEGTAPNKAGFLLIETPGCRPIPLRPITQCRSPGAGAGFVEATFALTYCPGIGEGLLRREEQLLILAVTYDAAYRSLLQFAGSFDRFLRLFNTDFLHPIEETLPLIGQLSRIPCFLAQCNE